MNNNNSKIDILQDEFNIAYQSLLEKFQKDRMKLISNVVNNVPDEVKKIAMELYDHECNMDHDDDLTSYSGKNYLRMSDELINKIGYEHAMKIISIIFS